MNHTLSSQTLLEPQPLTEESSNNASSVKFKKTYLSKPKSIKKKVDNKENKLDNDNNQKKKSYVMIRNVRHDGVDYKSGDTLTQETFGNSTLFNKTVEIFKNKRFIK